MEEGETSNQNKVKISVWPLLFFSFSLLFSLYSMVVGSNPDELKVFFIFYLFIFLIFVK